MRLMRELIDMIKLAHPSDKFFANIDKTLQTSVQAQAYYMAYERALRTLDTESWEHLKRKAILHFPDHRTGQLKQGFFNQLNEAFAYQHLVQKGYTSVRILAEDGNKKPDIEYKDGNLLKACEVKTLGISDEQIARWANIEAFSGSVYERLSEGYLNKLSSTLTKALEQISAHNCQGKVFLITLFDDFTFLYYKTYRSQINNALKLHSAPDVYVKIGLLGRRRIEKRL
jgi:hypothetical protein